MKIIFVLASLLMIVICQNQGYNLNYELQKQLEIAAQKNDKVPGEMEKIKKYLAENENSETKKPLTKEEMTPEQLNQYQSNVEQLLQEVIKLKFEMQNKGL